MEPRIETLSEKMLIGTNIEMSLANNQTQKLWQTLMPRLKEVENRIGQELFSLEVYDADYFNQFNPHAQFEKWAAIEVTNFDAVPSQFKTIRVPTGLYAVFIHRGPASLGPKTYQYIFGAWIPSSDYAVDTRPHLAVMGENYRPDDPRSEETLWIPIKPK